MTELLDILRAVPIDALRTIETATPELLAGLDDLVATGATTADVGLIAKDGGYQIVILPLEDEDDEDEWTDAEDMAEDMAEDYDDEDKGATGLAGLLDRLRSVFGKALSFQAENATIARNRKRAAARAPHEFVASVYATRKGIVRCRVCGGGMPDGGIMCAGRMAKDLGSMTGYDLGIPDEMPEEDWPLGELTLRSASLAEAYCMIEDALGQWSQVDAHYMDASPFVADGYACANCVAYCPEMACCDWVAGEIAADGLCKLNVIPDALRKANLEVVTKAAMKTENGEQFPAEAFAYVPDPERPSSWKLRLWETNADRETARQVGAALAALSPGGFRGNRVVIPAADLGGVKARVRAAWVRLHPDQDVPSILKADTYTPPDGVQAEAQRALDWLAAGEAGAGFTDTGRARASALAAGRGVSVDVIRRMASYLARHEVDKKGEGFSPGEPGYPSPGRVAWAAWGGDPAVSWTRSVLSSLEKDGPDVGAVHIDVPMGSRGRPRTRPVAYAVDMTKAIDVRSFVSWDSSGGRARGVVERISPDRPIRVPDTSVTIDASEEDPAVLIRLWEQTAEGWRPTEQRVGHRLSSLTQIEPLERSAMIPSVFAKTAEQRYTLGPWYVPDSYDAHGEWTDSEELQLALWDYVRTGDRAIMLQHDTSVQAGEWVEALTWPYAVTVPMLDADGNATTQEFPPGTVFMGVIWEPWAWTLVLDGKIRGYSMGGRGQRVAVDLETEGV